MNNMIHDIMSLYGFDEASGNFQANNYGRGGTGGDYVRAEAADGNGSNNANFNPPVNDGGTPRMQMYLWPGAQFGSPNSVTVGTTVYNASFARYTPAAHAGRAVRARSSSPAPAARPPPTRPRCRAGNWIAVVDGGTAAAQCSYLQRSHGRPDGRREGAGHRPQRDRRGADADRRHVRRAPVTIPAVAVTQADGTAIKAAIAAGTTTGSVQKRAEHPGIRDGDLENVIVLHEYTHGISRA